MSAAFERTRVRQALQLLEWDLDAYRRVIFGVANAPDQSGRDASHAADQRDGVHASNGDGDSDSALTSMWHAYTGAAAALRRRFALENRAAAERVVFERGQRAADALQAASRVRLVEREREGIVVMSQTRVALSRHCRPHTRRSRSFSRTSPTHDMSLVLTATATHAVVEPPLALWRQPRPCTPHRRHRAAARARRCRTRARPPHQDRQRHKPGAYDSWHSRYITARQWRRRRVVRPVDDAA